MDAKALHSMTAEARKKCILQEANISETENDLEKASKLANVINRFINNYIKLAIEADNNRSGGSVLNPFNLKAAINKEIEEFKPEAIKELKKSTPSQEEITANPGNIYQLAGAVKLAGANKATRNLSTTMGLLWERIANISPYAINPEIEFALKIKGIDLIAMNKKSGLIEYQQLKTQRNTLTGSQKERAIHELELHKNPVFCACFSLGNWTFNHDKIPRVSGNHFWERIGIDYKIIEDAVKKLILELENIFVEL